MTCRNGLFLALLTVVPACNEVPPAPQDEAAAAAPSPTETVSFECRVEISPTAAPITAQGSATGTDERAVKEAAWANACEDLPEGERPQCRNNERYSWTSGGGSVTSGNTTTYTTNITLTQVKPRFTGEGSAPTEDEACNQAGAAACSAAGANADCIDSAAYEKVGGGVKRTSTSLRPK